MSTQSILGQAVALLQSIPGAVELISAAAIALIAFGLYRRFLGD